MGGCVIDLRDADMEEGTIELDCFAFWGGIEVQVSKDWEVVMQGTPILGGMDVRTANPTGVKKRIVIKGSAIMGGVEVKN